MDLAGLIFDDSPHYLDHLAPFCIWLGCPLIICEPHIASHAQTFYPDLTLIETPLHALQLPRKTIACESPVFLRASFPFERSTFFWLPHGSSDKGYASPYLSSLEGERAFVYGQKMIDWIHAAGVRVKTIEVGNFRLEYFKKQNQNIGLEEGSFLYAPTWDDHEQSNSFWDSFSHLVNALPQNHRLYIRLHPNTLQKFPLEVELQLASHMGKKGVVLASSYSPIYPLLAKCSSYIGDMSSIGYDFLSFDRPMFFLKAKEHLPLHRCGEGIDLKSFDYQVKKDFSERRRQLYRYTFSENISPKKVKEDIL